MQRSAGRRHDRPAAATRRRPRAAAALVAGALLVTAACSGAPRPETVAAGDTNDGISDLLPDTTKGGSAGLDTDGDGTIDTTVTTDGTGAPVPGTSGGAGGTSSGGGGSSSGGGGTGGGGTGGGPGGGTGGFRSTLFNAEEAKVGITDTEIRMCAHAALTYGAAFNTSAEDLNVYWTAVNAAGGVYDRKVSVTYENDNYQPTTAREAAEKCKAKNIFMLLGGIGFDQIPAVREWAEQNRMLYFHHTATVNGSEGKQFSFTGLPTTEKMGAMFAELAGLRFRDRTIGIVKRNSENWEPGVRAFKEVAAHVGIRLDSKNEKQVLVNQGNYLQEIVDLKNNGVDVVWLWLNALESTEFIKQAKAQAYSPTFMVFPFNLTSQTLGDDALNPPLVGVAMFNAYSEGDYSGEFARYADDMQQFEAQYREHRPNVDLGGVGGDLLFLNWSAQKAMHQLLLRCGPTCDRNRFLEAIHGFKGFTNTSACQLDFTRAGPGNDHRGGWAVSVMEAYRSPSGKVNFRNTNTCVEHLL